MLRSLRARFSTSRTQSATPNFPEFRSARGRKLPAAATQIRGDDASSSKANPPPVAQLAGAPLRVRPKSKRRFEVPARAHCELTRSWTFAKSLKINCEIVCDPLALTGNSSACDKIDVIGLGGDRDTRCQCSSMLLPRCSLWGQRLYGF